MWLPGLVAYLKSSMIRARLPPIDLQTQDFDVVLSIDFILVHVSTVTSLFRVVILKNCQVVIRYNSVTRSVSLQAYLNYQSPVCAGQCAGVLDDTVVLTLTHVDTVDGTVSVRSTNGRAYVDYDLTVFRYARIVGETFLFQL